MLDIINNLLELSVYYLLLCELIYCKTVRTVRTVNETYTSGMMRNTVPTAVYKSFQFDCTNACHTQL